MPLVSAHVIFQFYEMSVLRYIVTYILCVEIIAFLFVNFRGFTYILNLRAGGARTIALSVLHLVQ